jgi:hypothetical protein
MLKQVQHDGGVSEETLSYTHRNMHDAAMILPPSPETAPVPNRALIVTPKAPLSVTLVTLVTITGGMAR